MEKYVLLMDKTGEIVKRDIVPVLQSPDLEDEINALIEKYREVIQSLEHVFIILVMGFYKCNIMMEENKTENTKDSLPEYDIYILKLKMNTDRIIDSIRGVKEKLMEHCCRVNDLTGSVKETEQTREKLFPRIEKMKEFEQILQRYIIKCDDYIGVLTVLNNELG